MMHIKILLSLISLFIVNDNVIKTGYDVGDAISDFSLKNTDGKMVSLSDYQNQKGVILIFDCNTCPYSKAYNSRIIALNEKYSKKGFPVIAINSNDPNKSPGDSFEEMTQQAIRNNYSFPYLFDESQKVARDFGATNTPHVFILTMFDKKFRVSYIGAIDNNVKDASSATNKYVEDAVDALLVGHILSTTKTKAIGCTIKWRD